MSYQVNFHSFLGCKTLTQSEVAQLQSPALHVAMHEAMMKAFRDLHPELSDHVQCGLGRVEVVYLGL